MLAAQRVGQERRPTASDFPSKLASHHTPKVENPIKHAPKHRHTTRTRLELPLFILPPPFIRYIPSKRRTQFPLFITPQAEGGELRRFPLDIPLCTLLSLSRQGKIRIRDTRPLGRRLSSLPVNRLETGCSKRQQRDRSGLVGIWGILFRSDRFL